jgi:cytochrome c
MSAGSRPFALVALFLTAHAWGQAPSPHQGDAARGKDLYQACTSCHSIDDDDIGPRHRGLVGRKAGSIPGYAYSAALKGSGIVWDSTTLDRWLTNPSAMVPGTKMFFLIDDPQKRADLIAYLAELK